LSTYTGDITVGFLSVTMDNRARGKAQMGPGQTYFIPPRSIIHGITDTYIHTRVWADIVSILILIALLPTWQSSTYLPEKANGDTTEPPIPELWK